jgi:hypothetical protein
MVSYPGERLIAPCFDEFQTERLGAAFLRL